MAEIGLQFHFLSYPKLINQISTPHCLPPNHHHQAKVPSLRWCRHLILYPLQPKPSFPNNNVTWRPNLVNFDLKDDVGEENVQTNPKHAYEYMRMRTHAIKYVYEYIEHAHACPKYAHACKVS